MPRDMRHRATQRDRLETLFLAAERVEAKFGRDEHGVPSDWTEWEQLRRALHQVLVNGDVPRDVGGKVRP